MSRPTKRQLRTLLQLCKAQAAKPVTNDWLKN